MYMPVIPGEPQNTNQAKNRKTYLYRLTKEKKEACLEGWNLFACSMASSMKPLFHLWKVAASLPAEDCIVFLLEATTLISILRTYFGDSLLAAPLQCLML
jgi:hypothetical protein